MISTSIGVAQASGLNEEFDRVIRGLPDELLHTADSAILDPAFSRDPYTPLGRLRDEVAGVVFRGEDETYAGVRLPNSHGHDFARPHAIALSHAAVSEIGSDRTRFINEGAYGASEKAKGRTINTYDGAEHRSLRRLFDSAIFGRRAMDAWNTAITEPTIEYLVQRVKRMIANGETPDGRRDLGLPAAYKSMSAIIGVPQRDLAHFVDVGNDVMSASRDIERSRSAMGRLEAYFAERLEDRKVNPQPDMMSIMSQAEEGGRKLTDAEVIKHCAFLLPGGIETTWRESANLVMCMALHPDAYRQVVEDPGLADAFVEETLRWAPSGFRVPRICIVDTEVDGVPMPAGTSITSVQGIANRDPKVFENPDTFDIHRESNDHLTFHVGVHYCMGQNLARFTFRTLLKVMARELPTLRLACDPSEVKMEGFGVRSPTYLPLTA